MPPFDPMQAVDAAFDAFGKAAAYTPPGGGTAIPCAVDLNSKDVDLGLSRSQAMVQGRALEVRKSEIAAPAKGGTFTLASTNETLKILDDPRCDDPDRLIWTMTVR